MNRTERHNMKCALVGLLFSGILFGVPAESAGDENGGAVFIGEYGQVEVRDTTMSLRNATRIPDMTHSYSVRGATLTPDRQRLLLAVSSTTRPLIVLDTETLELVDVHDIYFPEPKPPFLFHVPLDILAPTDRYVFMADESYTPEPDPYSSLLIDFERRHVRKIQQVAFSRVTDDCISPSKERMLGLWGDQLQVIDTATGVVQQTFNENPVHFPAFALDVHWDAETATLTLQWNSRTKEIQYSVLNINLKSGTATKTLIEMPKEAVLMNRDTKLGRVLIAYNGALGGQRGDFPLVTPRVRALLEKLDESVLALIPEPFSEIYVSPDLRLLFAGRYEPSERSIDDSDYISTLTVIDLNSKSVVSEIELLYQLQAILFR